MYWKYFVAWCPGIFVAIINGTIRQFWFKGFLEDLQAHQASVASFILLFGIYAWWVLPWLSLSSRREALRVGLFWLVLTVAFEFLFGHFVAGQPWEKLLHDYNVTEGRLWVVVLLWVTLAPVVLYRPQKGNAVTTGATR